MTRHFSTVTPDFPIIPSQNGSTKKKKEREKKSRNIQRLRFPGPHDRTAEMIRRPVTTTPRPLQNAKKFSPTAPHCFPLLLPARSHPWWPPPAPGSGPDEAAIAGYFWPSCHFLRCPVVSPFSFFFFGPFLVRCFLWVGFLIRRISRLALGDPFLRSPARCKRGFVVFFLLLFFVVICGVVFLVLAGNGGLILGAI